MENADLIFYLIDFPKILKELQALDCEGFGEDKVAVKLALKEQNGLAWRILEDMRFIASQALHQTETQPALAILLNKYDQFDGFPGKYIAHATPDEKVEISENIAPALEFFCALMQDLIKRELGTSAKYLKMIAPMSCCSLDCFKFFFPAVLRAVAGK